MQTVQRRRRRRWGVPGLRGHHGAPSRAGGLTIGRHGDGADDEFLGEQLRNAQDAPGSLSQRQSRQLDLCAQRGSGSMRHSRSQINAAATAAAEAACWSVRTCAPFSASIRLIGCPSTACTRRPRQSSQRLAASGNAVMSYTALFNAMRADQAMCAALNTVCVGRHFPPPCSPRTWERCGRLYPRIRKEAKEITAPSAPACSVPSWRVAVGGKGEECAAVGMAWPAVQQAARQQGCPVNKMLHPPAGCCSQSVRGPDSHKQGWHPIATCQLHRAPAGRPPRAGRQPATPHRGHSCCAPRPALPPATGTPAPGRRRLLPHPPGRLPPPQPGAAARPITGTLPPGRGSDPPAPR